MTNIIEKQKDLIDSELVNHELIDEAESEVQEDKNIGAYQELGFLIASLEGSTKDSINSFYEIKKDIDLVINNLKPNIHEFGAQIKKLNSILQILALLPNKLEDKISNLPEMFNNSVEKNMPAIAVEITKAQKEVTDQMNHATYMALENFKLESRQVLQELKENTEYYRQATRNITEESNRLHIRRLLHVSLISGVVSAFVTGLVISFLK